MKTIIVCESCGAESETYPEAEEACDCEGITTKEVKECPTCGHVPMDESTAGGRDYKGQPFGVTTYTCPECETIVDDSGNAITKEEQEEQMEEMKKVLKEDRERRRKQKEQRRCPGCGGWMKRKGARLHEDEKTWWTCGCGHARDEDGELSTEELATLRETHE